MDEIITSISADRSKNAQHAQFAEDSLRAIPEEMATKHGFTAQWTAYSNAVSDELACFQGSRAYFDTPDVVESDTAREDTYMFHKTRAKAYADYCPDPAKRKSGKTVMFIFDAAGDVLHADYSSETGILADVAEKLREEPYLSALADIDMEEAPGEIEAANEAFRKVYNKRSAEERDRELSFNMKTLRPVTDAAFAELAKTINALYLVNEVVTKDEETRTELKAIIDDVNAIVVRFRKVIGGNSSKDEEKKPDMETPGTETPGTETPDTENPDGQGGEQTTPTEPGGDETEQPQPGVDNDGDGSPEVV